MRSMWGLEEPYFKTVGTATSALLEARNCSMHWVVQAWEPAEAPTHAQTWRALVWMARLRLWVAVEELRLAHSSARAHLVKQPAMAAISYRVATPDTSCSPGERPHVSEPVGSVRVRQMGIAD